MQPYDREEMTDHGKEESESEEASGSEGKARVCKEERRQEGCQEEGQEGEQGEGCSESEDGEEVSAEEGACEVREDCTAGKGCVASEESDGTAEVGGSGRTVRNAGAGSDTERRLRTRGAAAVEQHGSFRVRRDRRISVARINRAGMRAALPS
jgi:hypothetical protein